MSKRAKIEPYWYVIILFLIIGAGVFIYHQITGQTPSRVAIHLDAFDFDVFWYGIIIVSGIALGSYVTARLALERANWVFDQHVPLTLRQEAIVDLGLPSEIQEVLAKRQVDTLGELLFQWGLNPARLGLNKSGQQETVSELTKHPQIEEEWLFDAPWRQWNPDYVWGGVAWCLILAIVGARLYHVLTPSPSMAEVGINSAADYFRSPLQLINLRNGGLGIYGGIIGGALGLFLYSRRHHISAIAWADLAVVGLALGQAIGRWGNFVNQELYGRPTNLPWAIRIDNPLPGYEGVAYFHPAFLYESLWSLLTFVVVLFLARRRRDQLQTGDLTALYLVFYAIGRILLELVRLDSRTFSLAGVDLGLPVATVVSIAIAVPMAALLIWRHVIARDES